ncbi:MAG: beta-L-arabinofuranosidase domain-containing protein [Blastocatellia bacterium]
MRPFFVAITLLIALSIFSAAAQQKLPSELAPETWPGKMPDAERAKLRPLQEQLLQAMRAHDDEKLRATREAIIRQMGKYAGVSEFQPDYGKPIDPSPPDLVKVERLWAASFKRMQGRHGWERAAQAKAQGRPQPRLRVSFRSARAYLHSHEAGLSGKDEFLKYAVSGFEYIASAQASTGAFGYPYFPGATEGLVAAAARVVKAGEARGLKMTEGNWVIEDLDDGGLQFDNGESGLGLLHAYALTGNQKYLDAARRAGEWAAKRPLVQNFNYNGFSGELLAQLYRVTGEKRYLDQAVIKMKYGVLPGQMENGRWFDQHNASIQYHSIMMAQLIELHLALKQAKAPYADEVKRRIVLGLDNLAEQITSLGAMRLTANEMLCLDALTRGLLVFGQHEKWEKAANIDVNYACNQFLPELEKRGEPMTETVAHYLLSRHVKEGKATDCELEIEKCATAQKKR